MGGNYKAEDLSDKFRELKEKFNKNYYKYWFYPYEKSPLIMDINNFPDIDDLYDDSGIIKQEFIDEFDEFKNDDNNISEIEQILFTTPDSDSYGDIYDKHPDIFNKIIYLYEKLFPIYQNILYFNLEDEVNYLFVKEKK